MRVNDNKAAARIRTQDAAADWSMKGKTVLFTGASRGMGRFAAIELARLGAEILVVGHNQARGAATVEAIRGTGGSAQFLRADMGDAAEVCALAAAVLDVTANVLDPGIVKGKSGSEYFEGPAPMGLLMSHVIPFFAAAGMQRGSEQYVRLAADPTLVGVSGTYFVSGKEKKKQSSSPLSLDPAVQKRIHDAAEAWAAPFPSGR
jgi:NAD(P)-dependent dehydrogenase (short-subunit alcohol dehydrogenase family)